MKKTAYMLCLLAAMILIASCTQQADNTGKSASEILGNPNYLAISYSGYRELTREILPDRFQIKEDMRILSAMGIKFIRTYDVYHDHAADVLETIHLMKQEDPEFEMYVMLGAWIDCKNAWTDLPDRIRDQESDRNAEEIARAVELAQRYPDIVKVIAVGNEAMVHWAWNYYVEPGIILRWVRYLQALKQQGKLPESLWITSSDNFASWGGGGSEYHQEDLNELIRAVDFISMHTYPMHDTHYNPAFWGVREEEMHLSDIEKIDAAMIRARDYAISQYESVINYMHGIGEDKPVHVGETGWATKSNEFYGDGGARAIDEYKSALYYWHIREWTNNAGISCFYFEAFDEQWKDAANPLGSENHFGLINLQSQAKYALWELVNNGTFDGLTRDGMTITKTYNGDKEAMMRDVKVPPTEQEIQEMHQK